ncbi:MAG: NAD/NADP-dependent octopine/nopaline dehydrogenase family protein [Thermoleophilia bacterium]
MAVERIAVLGGGNAGRTIAADMTLKGLKVNLFELPRFTESFAPVKESGEITLRGVAGEGVARLNLATHDIEAALEGVELILIAVPSFGVGPMFETCAPHLRPGDTVVFTPGAFACVVARNILKSKGIDTEVTLGEMCTLPYAARITGPTEVKVFINAIRLPTAALPSDRTPQVVEVMRQLYPVVQPAANVLDVALLNINPCIHPGPSILNTGRIEYADDFYLYAEGMTPGTRRVMVAIDQERQRVREAWGLEAPHYGLDPTPGVYEVFEHYFGYGGIDQAGVKLQGPLDMTDRYITEDVPYGLVFYASMGDLAGVDTPICDAIINLAGVINQDDYWSSPMTAANLGLAGMAKEEILAML